MVAGMFPRKAFPAESLSSKKRSEHLDTSLIVWAYSHLSPSNRSVVTLVAHVTCNEIFDCYSLFLAICLSPYPFTNLSKTSKFWLCWLSY